MKLSSHELAANGLPRAARHALKHENTNRIQVFIAVLLAIALVTMAALLYRG